MVLKTSVCLTSLELEFVDEYDKDTWAYFCECLSNSCVKDVECEFLDQEEGEQTFKFFQAVAKNPNITRFSVEFDNSYPNFLDQFYTPLKEMLSHLKDLEVSCIRIRKATKLQKLIAENTSLQHICLYTLFVTNSKFFKILDGIERNGSILRFSLSTKDIMKNGCEHMRNLNNLKKTKSVCETLMCIKRFRQTQMLDMIGRDMTKLLSKYLLPTYADAQTWTVPEKEKPKKILKKRRIKI